MVAQTQQKSGTVVNHTGVLADIIDLIVMTTNTYNHAFRFR